MSTSSTSELIRLFVSALVAEGRVLREDMPALQEALFALHEEREGQQ